MPSRKTTQTRKATKTQKKFFRIVAAYAFGFKTKEQATKAKEMIAKNKKAQISPIKKSGNRYVLSFKFSFLTPTPAIRDKVIAQIKEKSPNAKVTSGVVNV